ncbi:hypothetical protein [Candidatus Hodarchaeum mangrovi]
MIKGGKLLSIQCPDCLFVQTVIFCENSRFFIKKCKGVIRWDDKTKKWFCKKCNKNYSGKKINNARCPNCDKRINWPIPQSIQINIGYRNQ